MRIKDLQGTEYLIRSSVLVTLLSLFRVLSIKLIIKVINQSIAIFCLNVKYVEYANTKIQTLILLPPIWNHFFIIVGVEYLLLSLFFLFLPLFIFNHVGVFNFFLPVAPNCNIPNSLCSTREMSSCYHTHFDTSVKSSFNLSDLTINIFPSVTS